MKPRIGLVALLLGVAILIVVAFWWTLTDIRVKFWPEHVRLIYAKGALHDYLELRCLSPVRIRLLNTSGAAKVGDTYVGAYTSQAEAVVVWEIYSATSGFPVGVSIFPDGEYAVTWWYNANDPSQVDSFVSSTRWEHPDATMRLPASERVLSESAMLRRYGCTAPTVSQTPRIELPRTREVIATDYQPVSETKLGDRAIRSIHPRGANG